MPDWVVGRIFLSVGVVGQECPTYCRFMDADSKPRCIADCIEAFSFNTGTRFLAMEQLLIPEWGTPGEYAGLKKFLDLPVVRIIPGKIRNTTETWALLKASRPS